MSCPFRLEELMNLP